MPDVAIILAMGITLIAWNWRMLTREAVLFWHAMQGRLVSITRKQPLEQW